ncbi:hypothetical protein [Nostoc sp. CCY0012]|uniref:hypothetical protein n=1 Tax=Nostoc sp. CCY0012 TaxID=1056123 RepID=UPI0039C5E1C0
MKIVEETRTRLRLQHRPVNKWLSGACLFIGCWGFLIYCIFFEFASARLTCDRGARVLGDRPLSDQLNCELRRSSLLGRKERLRIFDIQEAYVKTTRQSRGGSSHQVIIVTSLGNRYLISNLSYQENQQVVQQINNFIYSKQQSLFVSKNQFGFLYFVILGILLVMIINGFVATSPVSNCTFYKSMNKLLIERKGLRGQQIIEEPLEKILRVDIRDKKFKYSQLYRAVIVLQSYEEIPINPEYTDEKSVRYAVSRINSFLNVRG